MDTVTEKVFPFLKWAGGKRWLVERDSISPPRFDRYIEPFLGGGAVYFHLAPKKAILSDINPDLIETYNAIKANWNDVWNELKTHQINHSKEYYYKQRSTLYSTPHERAAQFLYLNRTCWNGLYRVNLQGTFNVPIGTKNAVLLPTDNFAVTAKLLQNAAILCCDFETTINKAERGDFIFVDPPYTTAHNLNGFLKYNQTLFSWEDQIRLKNACYKAREKGAILFITNADHESIRELYKDDSRIRSVSRRSVISGNSKGRGTTSELLIELRP